MAQASYSFLDVAVLDEVRERFAAGDALVILSGDLEEVIWANGPGAALFGHADVDQRSAPKRRWVPRRSGRSRRPAAFRRSAATARCWCVSRPGYRAGRNSSWRAR